MQKITKGRIGMQQVTPGTPRISTMCNEEKSLESDDVRKIFVAQQLGY